MTEEDKALMKVLVTRQGQLVGALAQHPDLPRHGDTMPILIEMIAALKEMHAILSRSQIVIAHQ